MPRKAVYVSPVPLWLINIISLGFAMTLAVSFVYMGTAHAKELKRLAYEEFYNNRMPELLPENPYIQLSLEAKAAAVYDVRTGKFIYGKDADIQLPLASITKLMTALTALEQIPEYSSVPVPEGLGEAKGIAAGETWELKDLIDYTLVSSSNSGAQAIASLVGSVLINKFGGSTQEANSATFVHFMNSKAAELGLTQTYFLNPTGLDENGTVSGAYGSAKDVALLLSYILKKHPDLLDQTAQEKIKVSSLEERQIEATNTDTIVASIPGIIASKTGFTDLAGGNLAIAFDASFNQPFIVVVLGSSQEGRFTDVQKLVGATIDYLGARNQIKPPQNI